MNNDLTKQIIADFLHTKWDVTVLDSVDSTNTYAKSHMLADRSLVVANEQTSGHGRMGRCFFSPKGKGIYMSMIFDFEKDCDNMLKLTAMSAVCVCRVIEKLCGKKAKIKWVNDVYIGDKKVCGILCQGVTRENTTKMIVGIGLNIRHIDFPTELCGAGSLEDENNPRALYVTAIADELSKMRENIEDDSVMQEYRKRSNVIGQKIVFYKKDAPYEGVAVDINDKGHLIVQSDGVQHILSTGEITLRIKKSGC